VMWPLRHRIPRISTGVTDKITVSGPPIPSREKDVVHSGKPGAWQRSRHRLFLEVTTLFDIIVTVIIVLTTLRGLWRGFVRQVVGVAGAVAGYVLAAHYSGLLAAKYLAGFSPSTRHILGFLIIFIACLIASSIVASLLAKILNIAGLGIFNRIGGALMGGAKGCFAIAAVVLVLVAYLPSSTGFTKESRTIKYIRPISDAMSRYAPETLKRRYDQRAATKLHPTGPSGTKHSIRPLHRP
jgi:membrane protein required for colicin V production